MPKFPSGFITKDNPSEDDFLLLSDSTQNEKNVRVKISAVIGGKADLHHTHEIADVNGLQDKLDSIEGKIPVPEELDKEIVYVDKYSDLANLTEKSQEKLYFVYEENAIYSYNGTTFVEVDKPNNVIITEDIDSIPSMTLEDGNYSVIHIIKSEKKNPGELYLKTFKNKINAIKCIRALKEGVTLKQAKEIVDNYPNRFPLLLTTSEDDNWITFQVLIFNSKGVTLSYTLNSVESTIAKIEYNLEKNSNDDGTFSYRLSNAESVATYDVENGEWVWKFYAYLSDIDELAEQKADVEHTHEIADVQGLSSELDKMKQLIYAAL